MVLYFAVAITRRLIGEYPCSLCGEIIPYGKIHSVEEFVYLLSHCFNHYKSLPDGMIKKSIKDFLIGNVI